MDQFKVKCSRSWCKFKGSYPSLARAREAIAEHKAETTGERFLGVHEAVFVQKTPRGTRSPTSRRRLRR